MAYWVDGQAKARVTADQAAFAFLFDAKGIPSWVVRRDGNLIHEQVQTTGIVQRALGETDALPLAATVDDAGKLLIALRYTPHHYLVIASFGRNS